MEVVGIYGFQELSTRNVIQNTLEGSMSTYLHVTKTIQGKKFCIFSSSAE